MYVDFHSTASTYMWTSSPTSQLLATHGPIVVAITCPSTFRTLGGVYLAFCGPPIIQANGPLVCGLVSRDGRSAHASLPSSRLSVF